MTNYITFIMLLYTKNTQIQNIIKLPTQTVDYNNRLMCTEVERWLVKTIT